MKTEEQTLRDAAKALIRRYDGVHDDAVRSTAMTIAEWLKERAKRAKKEANT